jgi:hypothetical protein
MSATLVATDQLDAAVADVEENLRRIPATGYAEHARGRATAWI